MIFEALNLNKSLRNALDDLGYIYPTPIQEAAFPVIMSGKDVVGIAQTGTGKTFAYLLPLLRMHEVKKKPVPRVLIIVPTRELVLQHVEEIEKLTTYMTVRTVGVYGGTNINTQKLLLLDPVDIIVGTPGRTLDLALHGVLKLTGIKKLVIDEVDEMMNLGFRPQLKRLLDLLPERRQNLMFSATMTGEIEQLLNSFSVDYQKIEIAPHGTPLEQIIQRGYEVPNFYTKINLLHILLANDPEMTKILIFAPTKKMADETFEKLSPHFPGQIGVIHSNKSQNYRINTVKKFQAGDFKAIIATDIMARGLDISGVSHVINLNVPDEALDYIHRIGRTGRADEKGIAITFFAPYEEAYRDAIETLMDKRIPILPLPDELQLSERVHDSEKETQGDKNYLNAPTLKHSKGAFHEKKNKNKKVNRAHEKRLAWKKRKQKAKKRRR